MPYNSRVLVFLVHLHNCLGVNLFFVVVSSFFVVVSSFFVVVSLFFVVAFSVFVDQHNETYRQLESIFLTNGTIYQYGIYIIMICCFCYNFNYFD